MSDDKASNAKAYRAQYYKKKYHSDENYRQMILAAMKKKYVPITIRCSKCNLRIKKSDLSKEQQDKQLDSSTFECNTCNSQKQMKKRGRPKKIIDNNISNVQA